MSRVYNGHKIPGQKEWDGRKLSKGYVADYKPFVMVDGEGVRCSIYVSGCLFACEDCYSKKAWSFRCGIPYTKELQETILKDLSEPYVQGLTLLGGEPFLNTPTLLPLVREVRERFGHDKDIWSWSGYTFEQLIQDTEDKIELLEYVDVLVDGPFLTHKKDLSLQFRGSLNQRVLDVPKSLKNHKAIWWEKTKDKEKYEKEQII